MKLGNIHIKILKKKKKYDLSDFTYFAVAETQIPRDLTLHPIQNGKIMDLKPSVKFGPKQL